MVGARVPGEQAEQPLTGTLVLILVIDVALNVGVRIARARKRRALFPEPAPARSGGRFQRGAQPGQVG
jgi:hypothetical protein